MTVKLYRVVDRSGLVFHVNPQQIVAVDWASKRINFSNDENVYFGFEHTLTAALIQMGVELGDASGHSD